MYSRLEFWLKELIADLLAVHAMGPAYCFSFVEFLAHGSVENLPDDQHDQPAYRLGLIFDEIEYLGYFQSQEGVEKVLADMRSAAKAQSTADYNNTSRVVHKTIEQHLPIFGRGCAIYKGHEFFVHFCTLRERGSPYR